MRASRVVGIDMGTSSVKLALVDETGEVLASVSEAYRCAQPRKGWSEIEPEQWFEAALCGLDALLGQHPGPLRAISVTGQMHTTVFLDEKGESIRPAILWNDKRTREEVEVLRSSIVPRSSMEPVRGILSTGSPAANLYWLRNHEPEHFAALHRFLIGPDYLVYRLTGRYGTDYCEASTSSLFDLTRCRWSDSIKKTIGLPSWAYPEIRGSAVPAGLLRPEWMARFGLTEPVQVLTGTGDNAAAAVATGCLDTGEPFLSLGTSAVLMVQKSAFDFSSKGKNILFSPDGQAFRHLCQGVVQACGNGICWWQQGILRSDMDALTRACERTPVAPGAPLFYPHLNGDKTLYSDPGLTGGFLGLTLDTTESELSVAVLEGLAYAVKELIAEMCPHCALSGLKVIGGGARNPYWMQMLADVLHCDIQTLNGIGDAAYGAALLALPSGTGRPITGDRYHPRAEMASLYGERYGRYCRIHDAIVSVFSENGG